MSEEFLGVPEGGAMLRPVLVDSEGEQRMLLRTESGAALAMIDDLEAWLHMLPTRYPLKAQVRLCAERGLIGKLQRIVRSTGRKGHPSHTFALSREQLLLVLRLTDPPVPEWALRRALRCYDLAEGREQAPSAPQPAPEPAPRPETAPDPDGGPCVQLVPFLGGTLSALRSADQGWLVLKPACEALGIDYSGQLQRLKTVAWATMGVIPTVAADGRQREMQCLRSDRVAMWLATIDTGRIADPEARQRLELWQCHAADALDRWARGGTPDPAPPVDNTWRRIAEPEPPRAPLRSLDRDQWLSAQQVAERTGVGVRRVYRWIRACAIEHRRLGVRDIRIHVDALAEFLAAHDRAALPR